MSKENDGKSYFPEVNFHRNGYEIRSDILDISADFVKWEFEAKVKSGKLAEIPSVEDVLQTAERFNTFVKDCTKATIKTFLTEEKK